MEACQNETERNDLVEVLNELTQLVDLMKQRNGLEEQALAEEESFAEEDSLAEEQETIERGLLGLCWYRLLPTVGVLNC